MIPGPSTIPCLSEIRAVLFDLDDTLYSERAYVFSGFNAVNDWLRGRVPCEIDAGARMRALFEAGERRRVFDRLLEELGCADAGRLVPEMVACYRSHRPVLQLLPDAAALLERVKGRFHAGLISDGPLQMQQMKVQALGLSSWFDPILLTDQWGSSFWKPHPRAFEVAQERTGASGSSCVYIADNPLKDFIAPRRLGWRTIRVRRAEGIYSGLSAPPEGTAEFEVESLATVDLSPC